MSDLGSYELRRGILPPYGYIVVTISPEERTGTITTMIAVQGKASRGMHYIRQVVVSEKEARLVASAIRSQDGELTAADFYPARLEEILDRVQRQAGTMCAWCTEMMGEKNAANSR